MFYEEMIRMDIYRCSFEHHPHLGLEYLKCSATIKLKNRGFPLSKSVYSQITIPLEIFGEHEELVKIQEALIEALRNEKMFTTIYGDLNFSYKKTQNQLTKQWSTYAKGQICDFLYCKTMLEYKSRHKGRVKYGEARIRELEKELKAERKKANKVSIEPKSKRKPTHHKGNANRITKNYDATKVEIEDVELNDFMEELKVEMQAETQEENVCKPKSNILDNLFGDTKW